MHEIMLQNLGLLKSKLNHWDRLSNEEKLECVAVVFRIRGVFINAPSQGLSEPFYLEDILEQRLIMLKPLTCLGVEVEQELLGLVSSSSESNYKALDKFIHKLLSSTVVVLYNSFLEMEHSVITI